MLKWLEKSILLSYRNLIYAPKNDWESAGIFKYPNLCSKKCHVLFSANLVYVNEVLQQVTHSFISV